MTLEDTIITKEIADKVKKKHYKYYYVQPDPEFELLVKRFEPDEDDLEMFKGTNKRSRMIYSNDDKKYFDWENEKEKEFFEYLKENGYKDYESIEKVPFIFILPIDIFGLMSV